MCSEPVTYSIHLLLLNVQRVWIKMLDPKTNLINSFDNFFCGEQFWHLKRVTTKLASTTLENLNVYGIFDIVDSIYFLWTGQLALLRSNTSPAARYGLGYMQEKYSMPSCTTLVNEESHAFFLLFLKKTYTHGSVCIV